MTDPCARCANQGERQWQCRDRTIFRRSHSIKCVNFIYIKSRRCGDMRVRGYGRAERMTRRNWIISADGLVFYRPLSRLTSTSVSTPAPLRSTDKTLRSTPSLCPNHLFRTQLQPNSNEKPNEKTRAALHSTYRDVGKQACKGNGLLFLRSFQQ